MNGRAAPSDASSSQRPAASLTTSSPLTSIAKILSSYRSPGELNACLSLDLRVAGQQPLADLAELVVGVGHAASLAPGLGDAGADARQELLVQAASRR